jgi:hypothetical protein
MRHFKFPLLLLCAGAVLVLAGCEEPARRVKGGGGNAGAPPGGPPSGEPPANSGAPRIGQVAPEIQGTDADGKEFKLSDYRGKVVVLDFWGGW